MHAKNPGWEQSVLNNGFRLAKAVTRTEKLYSCRACPKECVKGRVEEISRATLNLNVQINVLKIAEAESQVHSYATMSWKKEFCLEVAALILTVCVTSASARI